MSADFFRKITNTFKKDIKDPDYRKYAIEQAVNTYIKRVKSKPAGDPSIMEPIDELVDKMDKIFINPIEIYAAAYKANPAEKKFLRSIVNDIVRREDFCEQNVSYFKDTIDIEENCFPYLLYLIKCYYNSGMNEEIVKVYETIYDKVKTLKSKIAKNEPVSKDIQPDILDALEIQSVEYLCSKYLETERADEAAIHIYEISFDENSDNPFIIRQLGRKYLRESRKDEHAINIYNLFIKQEPGNRDIVLALCDIYHKLGKEDIKVQLLEKYYKINPQDDEILVRLVEYYILKRKISSETIPLIKKVYDKNPSDINTLLEIAEYYASQKDLSPEAVSIYEKALQSSKKSLTIQFLLGRYYFEKKAWREVIRVYEGIRKELPDSSEAIIPLATAYAQYNRFDPDVLKLYDRALTQGSRNEFIANILCREYFKKQKRDARTIKIFKDVLDFDADNFYARVGLCDYYEHIGQYSKAIEEAIKLLQEKTDDADVQKILARSIAAFDFPDEINKLSVLPVKIQKDILYEANQKRAKSKAIITALANLCIEKEIVEDDSLMDFREEILKSALKMQDGNIPYLAELSEICFKKNARLQGINNDKQIYYLCKREISYAQGRKKFRYNDIFLKILQRLCRHYLDGGREDTEAEEIYTASYTLGSRDSKLILILAEIFMRKFSTSLLAMEVYQLALRETSHNPMLEKLLIKSQIENNMLVPVQKFIEDRLNRTEFSSEILSFTRELVLKLTQVPDSLIAKVEQIREKQPDNVCINQILSTAYLKKRKYDAAALQVFEIAHQTDPENQEIMSALAKCYDFTGDYTKSAVIYEKALKGDEEFNPDLKLQLAKNYLKSNTKTRPALEIVKQAIEVDPYNTELQLFLIDIYFEHGLKKEALNTIAKLVRDFPEIRPVIIEKLERERAIATWDVDLFLNLAYLYIDERRFDEALAELNKLFLNFKQHYGDLMDAYHRILKIDPNHVQAKIERAILYKLVGEFKDALKDLESLDEETKNNPNVLFELAEIYSSYINSIKDPDDKMIKRLGEIYYRLKDFKKCIESFQKLLQKKVYAKECYYYLARSFHQQDAVELAMEYYKKLEMNDEIKEYIYEAGDRLYFLNKHKKALSAYELILAHDITYKDVEYKIRELRDEIPAEDSPEREKIFETLSQRAQQRFELIDKIGSGNMGIVYKAYDRELDEIVALKILPDQFSKNEDAVNRFRQEAKSARKLSHAYIVRIHDIGEEASKKYISMEFIDGGDLKDKLFEEKKLNLETCLKLSIQIADALSYAHKMNIIHRDIKPANILLTSYGDSKLSDFGIASIIENKSKADTNGLIIGTPMYMSPEQAEGSFCGTTSDVYSFGVVMYEMISGSPPFTVGNIAYHHIFSKPPALIDVDPDFVRIVFKCLQKKTEARYQSMTELLTDLKTLKSAKF